MAVTDKKMNAVCCCWVMLYAEKRKRKEEEEGEIGEEELTSSIYFRLIH